MKGFCKIKNKIFYLCNNNTKYDLMRKLFVTILLVMATCHINAQQAKYVFYFIGDGMGLNQVNTTEMYLAEVEGKIGIKPLKSC